LSQGGLPQWIWERTADPLKWEIVPSQAPEGHTVYELKVACGLEILRLQFFTADELQDLRSEIGAALDSRGEAPPTGEGPEPSPERREGVVSNPDFASIH